MSMLATVRAFQRPRGGSTRRADGFTLIELLVTIAMFVATVAKPLPRELLAQDEVEGDGAGLPAFSEEREAAAVAFARRAGVRSRDGQQEAFESSSSPGLAVPSKDSQLPHCCGGSLQLRHARQQGLDRGALAVHLAGQRVEPQGHAGHGVAQDHAEQRDRIARVIPGIPPARKLPRNVPSDGIALSGWD